MKEERLSIRVSSRTMMLVQEIAERTNVPKSTVIRALIDRSLSELEEKLNQSTGGTHDFEA